MKFSTLYVVKVLGVCLSIAHAAVDLTLSTSWESNLQLEALELISDVSPRTINDVLLTFDNKKDSKELLDSVDMPSDLKRLLKSELVARSALPRINSQFSAFKSKYNNYLSVLDCPIVYVKESNVSCTPEISENAVWHNTYYYHEVKEKSNLIKQSYQVYISPSLPHFQKQWNSLIKSLSESTNIFFRFKPTLNSETYSTLPIGYFTLLRIKELDYSGSSDQLCENVEERDVAQLSMVLPTLIKSLEDFVVLVNNLPTTLCKYRLKVYEDRILPSKILSNTNILSGIVNPIDALKGLVFINGLATTIENLNWFKFTDLIFNEFKLKNTAETVFSLPWNIAIHGLSLKPENEKTLMKIQKALSPRYKITEFPQIIWGNDIENDPVYSHFSSDFETLKKKFGPLQTRRNIFHLILFINLSNNDDLKFLDILSKLLAHEYPLRVGVIPLVDDDLNSNSSILATALYEEASLRGFWAATKYITKEFPTGITPSLQFHNALRQIASQYDVKNCEFFLNGESISCDQDVVKSIDSILIKQAHEISQGAKKEKIDPSDNIVDYIFTSMSYNRRLNLIPSKDISIIQKFSKSNLPELFKHIPKSTRFRFVYMSICGSFSENVVKTLLLAQEKHSFALDTSGKCSIDFEEPVIVLNGAVYENIPQDITVDDILQLLFKEKNKRILPIFESVRENYKDVSLDLIWRVSSFVWHVSVTSYTNGQNKMTHLTRHQTTRYQIASKFDCSIDNICFEQNSLNSTAAIKLEVWVDPVTYSAQIISNFLFAISNLIESLSIKIFWISNPDHSAKLNTFSRFRFEFPDNLISQDLKNMFKNIDNVPTEPLYSFELKTPHPWVTESKSSLNDLDNLVLKNDVTAEYGLIGILIEGHCYELETGFPPRGLQFIIKEHDKIRKPEISTIVMANLGYFQLGAPPGEYKLALRDGPSANIYQHLDINVTHIRMHGSLISVTVSKKPSMKSVQLIDSPYSSEVDRINAPRKFNLFEKFGQATDGIIKSVKSLIGTNEIVSNELNVFTVVSGHSYERLLTVMLQSVVNTSSVPVKFWLIESFLSPSFKLFLPELAKEVHFTYELIKYSWPDWLNKQTEKQRIIWAYKILFLDVLFPLGLKRIIFVDADQVVRTDLVKLQDMDLNGRVYGYTPFCDSRKNMQKYRFWESGYWKKQLRGKPYHISALYVVDLVRFRQLAVGDTIREAYHSLSRDPNSLANLDQDLPNVLQEQIPIFSLPQDWLWCETWCDDKSLKNAKTIDLCNNPARKESKIDRARRLIPEWNFYDRRARKIKGNYFKYEEENEEPKSSYSEEL